MGDITEVYRVACGLFASVDRPTPEVANDQFRSLVEECEPFGVLLRRNNDTHYQLIGGGRKKWIVDIWPGRCHIRTSGLWPYGFLHLPPDWRLADVVSALAEKMGVANGNR